MKENYLKAQGWTEVILLHEKLLINAKPMGVYTFYIVTPEIINGEFLPVSKVLMIAS